MDPIVSLIWAGVALIIAVISTLSILADRRKKKERDNNQKK